MVAVGFQSHKEMENVVFSKAIMKHEEQIIILLVFLFNLNMKALTVITNNVEIHEL